MIPASVANTEFGKLLPSLADGTCTPEQFAQTARKIFRIREAMQE